MSTKVVFDKEAKSKLLSGVRILADAVSTTLGPRGLNVAIAKADPYGAIYDRSVVHDGFTVAKSIDIEDEFENMGAKLLYQASQKQVQDVGDGTTVAIILARSILEEINARVVAGVNPMELRSQVEDSIDKLVKEIERLAIPVKTYAQKKQIATIAAEDEKLGELIAKTINDIGADGIVAVEESKNSETTVERQEGMQLEKGYAHQLFTTNPERMEAILENPLILPTDKDITTLESMVNLLNEVFKAGEKLVIIANPPQHDALAALIENKLKGVIPSIYIFAPSFGMNQENILQDIAIFTGGKFVTKDAGHKFEDLHIADLGRAEYVTANKNDSLIVGGKGKKADIEKRIQQIKEAIELEDQEYDKEKLKERLAKLTSGIAVIKVGGNTEVEMKERVERVKDAVEATKAAVKTGIVPGGEVIYLTIREKLAKDDLLYKVLFEPYKKLLANAGFDSGQYYERMTGKTKNTGVDVTDGELKDMVVAGIVDPAAVPINALLNAASVSIQIATTGAIVVPSKNDLQKLSQKKG